MSRTVSVMSGKSLSKLESLINYLLNSAFKHKKPHNPTKNKGWRIHKKFDLYYYGEGFHTLMWSYVDSTRHRNEEQSNKLKTYMNFSVTYV